MTARNPADQRRAPRTNVDIEAELHLAGQLAVRGVIQDLSIKGSLFVPESTVRGQPGVRGRMRFAVPTTTNWVEPSVELRRLTASFRATGDAAQAIGFEFAPLPGDLERAVASACLGWTSDRMREYTLATDVFVQGLNEYRHYSRFGKLLGGSRNRVRLTVPESGEITPFAPVRLKVTDTSVMGEVEELRQEHGSVQLIVRLSGWGRDFFLHEARRLSPGGAARLY
jgi:hypothetical protein